MFTLKTYYNLTFERVMLIFLFFLLKGNFLYSSDRSNKKNKLVAQVDLINGKNLSEYKTPLETLSLFIINIEPKQKATLGLEL